MIQIPHYMWQETIKYNFVFCKCLPCKMLTDRLWFCLRHSDKPGTRYTGSKIVDILDIGEGKKRIKVQFNSASEEMLDVWRTKVIIWILRLIMMNDFTIEIQKFESIFAKQSLTGLIGHPMWSVDTCRRTETISPLLLFLKTFFFFLAKWKNGLVIIICVFILAINMHCITCMILRRMLSFEKHLARLHIIFLVRNFNVKIQDIDSFIWAVHFYR